MTTDRASPAHLIRRELFFVGWGATINGRRTPIAPAHTLLQVIDVPSGVARISFHYTPPYAAATTTAFLIGLLILAEAVVGEIFKRRQDAEAWSARP